jgi:hypothetical protein
VVVGDGVPHSETSPHAPYQIEEDTAMAAVESPASERWLEERDASCDGEEAVVVSAGVEAT